MRKSFSTWLALFALLVGSPSLAVVAPPETINVRLANGVLVRGVHLATEDGEFLMDSGQRIWQKSGAEWHLHPNSPFRLAKTTRRLHRPIRGTSSVVALRVAFRDLPGTRSRLEHVARLFGRTRSLCEYYLQVSDAQLSLSGEVFPLDGGWFQLPESEATFGADSGAVHDHGQKSREDFVAACVAAADPAVDFSQFDWDGDGAVDHLLLIHAGSDQAATGRREDMWSRQIVLENPLQADGVRIESAMIVAEDSPLGTYCHEFAHDLGAPDLYGANDVGPWGLMGAGCWNGDPPGSCPARLSAPLVWDMDGDPRNGHDGWTIPSVARVGQPAQVAAGPLALFAPDQRYVFLVEERTHSGYDVALPSEGLLVYQIDLSDGKTTLLLPERAAGRVQSAALQPGEHVLLPTTGNELRVLAPGRAEILAASLQEARSEPAILGKYGLKIYPNPFRVRTRIQISGKERTRVRIFDLRGRLVVDFGYVRPGNAVRWDARDASGCPVASGTYLVHLDAASGRFVGKVTVTR